MEEKEQFKTDKFVESEKNGERRHSQDSVKMQKEPLLDDEDVTIRSKKKEEKPMVSFMQLFRFADFWDWMLIVIGSVCGILCGAGLPLMLYLFSDLSHIFTVYGRYKLCDLTYATCFSLNYTTLNETVWNSSVKVDLDTFEEQSMVIVYYLLYAAVLCFVTGVLQVSTWVYQANRQTKRIRIAYFKSILRQDIGYHDVTSAGELNERLTSKIHSIRGGIGEKVSFIVQYTSCSLVALLIGFISSWKITLIAFSVAPFMGIAQTVLMMVSSVYAKKEQAAYAKAGSIAEEAISAIRTVVSLGCQHKKVERYSAELGDVRPVEIKRGFLSGFSYGVTYCTWFAMYGVSFWYGTKLILAGEIRVNDVMIAVFEVLMCAFGFGTAGSFFDAIASARTAGVEIFEVIDRVPEIDVFSEKGNDPTGLRGDIVFKNVHFSYPSRKNTMVLNGLSFSIKHDTNVALVGTSGVGKSTVVQLLQRFYDCQEGSISVQGSEIKSLHLRKYREMIGVVSQEPVLFATTIAENIRWGREGITDEEIIEAAKQANAYDFIMTFPDKFETLVGEGGGQMSGGQKQRIAIARAIARNPKILLLDEATSALDTESESIVQAALEKASAGRTTIVIAHRLSTVRNADKIVTLQNGKVMEEGSHDELLNIEDGIYAKLIKLQTSASTKADDRLEALYKDIEHVEPKEQLQEDDKEDVGLLKNKDKSDEEEFTDEDKKEMPDVSYMRILKENKPEWPLLTFGLLFSIIAGCADPLNAILIGEVLNIFTLIDPEDQVERATFLCVMFVLVGMIVLVASAIEATIFAKTGVELTIRMRRKAFQSLLRQDISYFDDPRHSTGALCTRLSTDALHVQGCTGVQIGTALKNVATLVFALTLSFVYGWKLTLVTLASVPFLVVAGMFEAEVMEFKITAEEKLYEDAGQVAVEAIRNIRTVASLTREKTLHELYAKNLHEPTWIRIRKALVMGIGFGFAQCVIFFTFAASFRYAIELLQTGEMTFDNTYKVLIAITFGSMAIAMNSSMVPDYTKAKVSARKMFALFDTTPTIDAYSKSGQSPAHCKGEIALKSVLFSYPTRPDVPVLKGMSVTVKPGQTIALVGHSGSGKSTTVQLVERFYDPQEGCVTMDGVETTTLNVSWLRQQMGLVSQEPVLFALSIKENICYGDCTREASQAEVEAAAKNANIHDFIVSLPEGYSTNVGAKGGQLSGGQKQRVAIARALIRNPKVLLLDEATSALDTESEKIVQAALDAAREGRTSIVIAHRLSTVRNADQIVVINNGVVVEVGKHDELIAQKGAYYSLVNAQLFV